jgi:hypothetical protein
MDRPSSSPRPLRDHIRVAPGTRNAAASLPKEQEFDDAKLMALLQSATKELHGVRFVHLHLCLLENTELADMALITRLLTEVAANSGYVQLFHISNGDLIMFYKAVKFSAIEDACRKIEAALFAKTRMIGVNPYGEEALYSILDLSHNFVHMIRYLEALVKPERGGGLGAADAKPPINPEELAKIDNTLAQFDLSPYLLNQAVINLRGDDDRTPEYYELYISVAGLQAKLSPDFDLSANRWLFKFFTASLDLSMLRSLNHGLEFIGRQRIGLNINLSTALSPSFTKFDERLPAPFRGRVILEIDKADLMENLHLYRELLRFAADRDYRICIDGLDAFWVQQFDFESLSCDYAKIFWSNELMTLEPDAERAFLDKLAAAKTGPCKFILARCGAVTGLLYANKNGIDLVQGYAVDAVVRKGIKLGDAIKTAMIMEG